MNRTFSYDCCVPLAHLLVALTLAQTSDPPPTSLEPDIENLGDITELLEFETDVASSTALSLRETPAIVTVVTRDEIQRAGARDLIDVLALVPGMGFGVDVQGVDGIGFRGLWGHEGRVLFMVDGQPFNELLYGSISVGNHFPVELIERIEIIRGPGSAVYGGFAELAVIDIITRTAASLKGGAVSASYGRMRDSTGRWNGSAAFGYKKDELEVVGQAAIGASIRSDRIYVDANGDRFDMQDASDLKPGFVNVGARFHGLEARFIHDDFRMTEQSDFGENAVAPLKQSFRTTRAELKYAWRLAESLTVTPKVSLTIQKPWNQTDQTASTFYNKTARRITAGLTGLWTPLTSLSVAVGGDVWLDRASLKASEADIGLNVPFDGETSVNYQNYVGFADVLWRTWVANIEGGARVEHHSHFGSSFVPRLALTRVFGDFHVKGLASRAFRAPVIENIATNPDIQPERTTAFELEGGYTITSRLFVSANLFDLTVSNPVVYSFDEATGTETYRNVGNIGSRGVEGVLRYAHAGSYATLGYSFYTTAGKDTSAAYEVPGRDNVLAAWPAHKLTANTSVAITRWLSVGGTAVGMTRRYTFTSPSFAPVVYLSAAVFVHDVLLEGLEGSLSLHNIGDARNPLIQPYDGGHPPYVGPGREVFLRVAYAF